MKQAAKRQNIEVTIQAVPEIDLNTHLVNTDIILIGPQIRYLEPKIIAQAKPFGIRVAMIEPIFFGMMDGEKVLEQAKKLFSKR